jgi:UDP-GlcNAc:undecaprenyl-phosphate GlcNAc-1-phosphate transferase
MSVVLTLSGPGLVDPRTSTLVLSFACPFLIAWVLTAGLIRWAPRLGLVDYPSVRKVHTHPTPRGGGLAIFIALVLTAWLISPLSPLPSSFFRLLLLGLCVVVLGLADDLRPLPWQVRLCVQAGVAVAAVLVSLPPTGWSVRVLAVLWIVGLINAFNMLDNMDALSGGVAWIAAGFLVVAGVMLHWSGADHSVASVLPYLMLMGALSGFLWFNAPPARIFMGDAGSTFLGFILAVGGIDAALRDAGHPWSWAVPLCIFAVPCYDLVSVVLLRLRQGRSPFHADKQHLSHRLVQRGCSSPVAVRLIYVLALASGVAGLLLYFVASWTGAVLVLLHLALWWAALAGIEYFTYGQPVVGIPEPPARPRSDKTERLPNQGRP